MEVRQRRPRSHLVAALEGELRGDGVVGEQPTLAPGESFTYTSGCPLPTTQGIMSGAYLFVTSEGETFHARIPAFSTAMACATSMMAAIQAASMLDGDTYSLALVGGADSLSRAPAGTSQPRAYLPARATVPGLWNLLAIGTSPI